VRRIRGAKLHDALLLISVGLGLAACFIGEFERGAYGALFAPAQGILLALLLLDAAVGIQRAARRCPFHPLQAALWLMALWFGALLYLGIGRFSEDNTVFVTMRQIPAMLQIALSGALFCFAPFPAARKRRPRPAAAPAE
jgi:Kef-type K+ transport system membrane component KefB